jgi:3-deoxy-D-manno-octulosonic-acid transferase
MPYLLNVVYLLLGLMASPVLVYKVLTTGKYRRGMACKLTGRVKISSRHPVIPSPRQLRRPPVIWFHGVSVGEIHLLRQVVSAFRLRHPRWQCVISTTTDTGFDEACKHFADLDVTWWPLDFSWAVDRALRRVKPALVVLAEGELWPNFLLAARRRRVPVAVINARMSPGSFRHYRLLGRFGRRMLAPIGLVAAQTEDYAANYRALGMAPERVRVTGSVKYDGVVADRRNPRTLELGRLLGIAAGDRVWVCGSTQAPEETIAIGIFRRLKQAEPNLRLILVPRQRERFEEVAGLLRRAGQAFLRRSEISVPARSRSEVILVDTIGELSAVWGLADLAFVGGSLDGRRGGQNMIEPAAYGVPVLFGPHVWNFRAPAASLVAAGAALQVADATGLKDALRRLLADPVRRHGMGIAGQRFVQQQQGATEQTVRLLDELLADKGRSCRAA